MDIYSPGTYVKGAEEREAVTPSEAVALVFKGYSLKAVAEPELAPKPEAPKPTAPKDTK